MGRIVLSDGGEYHRPGRPHVFGPELRAAAHYLKAVEEVDSAIRRKLSEEVLGKHPFPSGIPGWQGVGLSPKRVVHKPMPGQPWKTQRERFEKARPLFKAFRQWTNDYYMWSPFVLDLLYRTLELWDGVGREIAELQGSIRQEEEYEELWPLTEEDQRVVEFEKARLQFLKKEQKGWGWWVDFLSSDITIPQLNDWFLKRAAEKESHRRLFERMDRLRIDITWGPPSSAPSFQVKLILEGWQPEVETWEAAKRRFQGLFDQAIEEYRQTCEERLKSGYLNPRPKDSEHVKWGNSHRWEAVPTKRGNEHFKWLARRQLQGWTSQKIADRHSVEAPTVREGLRRTARLLQIELRPSPVGRPSAYDDL